MIKKSLSLNQLINKDLLYSGNREARTPTSIHHRPNGFQDRPLHQFEYVPTYFVIYVVSSHQDLNLRPLECKSSTLNQLSYERIFIVAERVGFEPLTSGL